MAFKDTFNSLSKGLVDVLDSARMGVLTAVGSVSLGAVFFAYSYNSNNEKSQHIPLNFTEIKQTTRLLKERGQTVPAITRFYAHTHEAPMKVFEAHNLAYTWSADNTERFAYELEKKIDPSLAYHAMISKYTDLADQDAKDVLNALSKLVVAEKALPGINNQLNAAWAGTEYEDITHTAYRAVVHTDSKGNTTTTMEPYTVYDYTINTYDYHKDAGEQAANLLNAYARALPDVDPGQGFVAVTETGAENEQAMRNSMRYKLGDKQLTEADYIRYANDWSIGSNLVKYLPIIERDHAALLRTKDAWNAAKGGAHSDRVITYVEGELGGQPQGYLITDNGADKSKEMYDAIRRITDGIDIAHKDMPELNKKAHEFVNVALHGQKGDAKKLGKEVMRLAREIYQSNFEGGLDIAPFKWGDVILLTILGAALGGGAAYGAAEAREKYLQGKGRSKRNPAGYGY